MCSSRKCRPASVGGQIHQEQEGILAGSSADGTSAKSKTRYMLKPDEPSGVSEEVK